MGSESLLRPVRANHRTEELSPGCSWNLAGLPAPAGHRAPLKAAASADLRPVSVGLGSAGPPRRCPSGQGSDPPGAGGLRPGHELPQAGCVWTRAHTAQRASTLLPCVTPTRDRSPEPSPPKVLVRPERPGGGSGLHLPQGGEYSGPCCEWQGFRPHPSLRPRPCARCAPPLAPPSPAVEGRKAGQRVLAAACSHALRCQPRPTPALWRPGHLECGADSMPGGHRFLSQWARAAGGFPPFDPCQFREPGWPGPCQLGHRGGWEGSPAGPPALLPGAPVGRWPVSHLGTWTCPTFLQPETRPHQTHTLPGSRGTTPLCPPVGPGPALPPPSVPVPRLTQAEPTGVPGTGQGRWTPGAGGAPDVLGLTPTAGLPALAAALTQTRGPSPPNVLVSRPSQHPTSLPLTAHGQAPLGTPTPDKGPRSEPGLGAV